MKEREEEMIYLGTFKNLNWKFTYQIVNYRPESNAVPARSMESDGRRMSPKIEQVKLQNYNKNYEIPVDLKNK